MYNYSFIKFYLFNEIPLQSYGRECDLNLFLVGFQKKLG